MCARASVRATRLALAHLAKQCQHLGPALSAVVQGEDARLHGERRGKVGGGLGFSAAQAKRQTADDRGDRHPHDRTADIEAHSKKGGGKTADDGQRPTRNSPRKSGTRNGQACKRAQEQSKCAHGQSLSSCISNTVNLHGVGLARPLMSSFMWLPRQRHGSAPFGAQPHPLRQRMLCRALL